MVQSYGTEVLHLFSAAAGCASCAIGTGVCRSEKFPREIPS
jgi:hypothetical protein